MGDIRGGKNSESITYPTAEDWQKFPEPNFVNPASRKGLILGVELTVTTLAILIVCLRFYARTVIKRLLGWDDWLMAAALLCSITITILHCLATRYAAGLHLWDIRLEWIRETGIFTYVSLVFFAPAVSFSKISLSLTHLRILPSRLDRTFAKGAILFSIGYLISITIVNIFQCRPIDAYWDMSRRNYTCVNERAFNYASQALNSVSDFLIFLWPIRSLLGVRVPVKQRMILIFVFCIGSLVCITGIFRIYFLHRYFHTFDYFWTGSIIYILHSMEINLAIICGCLPGIKPILSLAFPRTFNTTTIHTDKSFSQPRRLGRVSLKPELPPPSRRTSEQSMVEVPIKLDHTEFAPTSPAKATDRAHWSPIAPPPVFQYPKSPIVPVERVYESGEEYRPPLTALERPQPAGLYLAATHTQDPSPQYQETRGTYRERHHSDPHPGKRMSGI